MYIFTKKENGIKILSDIHEGSFAIYLVMETAGSGITLLIHTEHIKSLFFSWKYFVWSLN